MAINNTDEIEEQLGGNALNQGNNMFLPSSSPLYKGPFNPFEAPKIDTKKSLLAEPAPTGSTSEVSVPTEKDASELKQPINKKTPEERLAFLNSIYTPEGLERFNVDTATPGINNDKTLFVLDVQKRFEGKVEEYNRSRTSLDGDYSLSPDVQEQLWDEAVEEAVIDQVDPETLENTKYHFLDNNGPNYAFSARQAEKAMQDKDMRDLFNELFTKNRNEAKENKSALQDQEEELEYGFGAAKVFGDFNSLKDRIIDSLVKKYPKIKREAFELQWENLTPLDRLHYAGQMICELYLGDLAKLEYEALEEEDYGSGINFLATLYLNSGNHKKEANRLQSEWTKDRGLTNYINYTEEKANEAMDRAFSRSGWDPFRTATDLGEWAVRSLTGFLGNMANIGWNAGEEELNGTLEALLKQDADVAAMSANYLNLKVPEIIKSWYTHPVWSTAEAAKNRLKQWLDISREHSNIFKIEEGSHIVDMSKEDQEKNLATYKLLLTVAGDEFANLFVNSLYKDVADRNQTTMDKITNTSGLFAANFIADAASLGAVAYAAAIAPFSSKDFTEILVDNPLMQSAVNLQETGIYTWGMDDEKYQKYADAQINRYLIYKSADEESSVLSADDIYDLVGQYGYTAASTFLSLGGSKLLTGLTKTARGRLTKTLIKGWAGTNRWVLKIHFTDMKPGELTAMQKLAKWANTPIQPAASEPLVGFSIRQSLNNSTNSAINSTKEGLRKLLRGCLTSGITREQALSESEILAKAVAGDLYYGNLAIGGLMGSAEGGLEAVSTYRTFVDDNIESLFGTNGLFTQLKNTVASLPNSSLEIFMKRNADIFDPYKDSFEGYSLAGYDLARLMLSLRLADKESAIRERILDDGLDAALCNFISNSFINGFCNIMLKEGFLAKDTREAIRTFRGGKTAKDFINVIFDKGKWVAKPKGSSNSWTLFARKTAYAVGRGVKLSAGEGLEEYTQGISDNVARAMMETDIKNYVTTVLNSENYDAIAKDWSTMLNLGFKSLGSELSNTENLKAALFGFLSSLMGGFSPSGLIRGLDPKKLKLSWRENKQGGNNTAMNIAKNVRDVLLGTFEGGIINSYRELTEERVVAQHLSDAVNTWLSLDKNQLLLSHFGGMIGLEKAYKEAVAVGDLFGAEDSKLDLSIENISMLESLKGTNIYEAYMRSISDLQKLSDRVPLEDFDDLGNYIGKDTSISSLINQYKKHNGEVKSTKSDKEILEAMLNKADEFVALRLEVMQVQDKLSKIFKVDSMDPLVVDYLSKVVIKNAHDKLRVEDIQTKFELTKKAATFSDETSGLSEEAIIAILTHGSVESIKKQLTNILEQIGKSTDKDKRALFRQLDYLNRVLVEIESLHTKAKAEGTSILNFAKQTPIITAKDLASLDINILSSLIDRISKGQHFTEELKLEVQTFLNAMLNASLDDPIAAAINTENDTFILDLKDFYLFRFRRDSYNLFLLDYIKDPSSLENRVAALRKAQRKNSIKFLYKNLFTFSKEVPLTKAEEAIRNKIEELKQDGKIEDAELLERVMNEDPVMGKFLETKDYINRVIAVNVDHGSTLNPLRLGLVKAALLTLAINGRLDIKGILTLINNNDVEKVMLYLQLNIDGVNTFTHLLAEGGVLLIDPTLIDEVSQLVNDCRTAMSKAALKDNRAAMQVPTQPTGKREIKDTGLAKPALHKAPPKPTNPEEVRPEPVLLEILALGSGITIQSAIGRWLVEYNALENIRHFDLKKHIYFISVNVEGTTYVVAAYEDKNATTKHLAISNSRFMPIGIIPLPLNTSRLSSPALYERAKALPNNTIILLPGNRPYITPQHTSEELAHTSLDIADPLPFITFYTNEDNTINEDGLTNLANQMATPSTGLKREVEESSVSREEGGTPTSHYVFNQTEVTFAQEERGYESRYQAFNSLRIQQEDGTTPTVGELLRSVTSEEDKPKVIKILSTNEFFKEFFEAWSKAPLDPEKTALNYYSALIQDFFYLGLPSDIEKATSNNILVAFSESPEELTKTLVISIPLLYTNTKLTLNVLIPWYKEMNLTLDKEILAFNFLQLLDSLIQGKPDPNNPESNIPSIAYGNPNVSNATTQPKGDPVIKNFKKRANILKGLIRARYIKGYDVLFSRKVLMPNPFFLPLTVSSVTQQRRNGNTDPAPGVLSTTPLVNINNLDPLARKAVEALQAETKKVSEPTTVDAPIIEGTEPELVGKYEVTADDGTVTNGARVTSAENAIEKGKATKFEGKANPITLAFGNTFDHVIREFWKLINSGKTFNKLEFYTAIGKTFKNGEIPNVNSYLMKLFLGQLERVARIFKDLGWIVIPEGVSVYGDVTVNRNGGQFGTLTTAGTLDLLVYDTKKHKFVVVDIKTIHGKTNKQKLMEDRDANWSALTSMYAHLCLLAAARHGVSMEFDGCYILPLFLDYNIKESVPVEDDLYITGNYQLDNTPDFLDPTLGLRTDNSPVREITDILHPVPMITDISYNYDTLSPTYLSWVKQGVPVLNPIVPVALKPQVPTAPPAPAAPLTPQVPLTPATPPTYMGSGVIDLESKKTESLAKYTDFINNRIAPLKAVTISFWEKVTNSFSLLPRLTLISTVIQLDWATTFFNGSVHKLLQVTGFKAVTFENTQQALLKIRDYYQGYVSKKEEYIKQVSLRYTLNKALYDYLQGTINDGEFHDILLLYGLEASKVAEIVEYETALDKEAAKKAILDKLEASKAHLLETLNSELEEINHMFADFEAKLEFLNSPESERMMRERMASMRTIVLRGLTKVISYNLNHSITDMLARKQGTYSTRDVLSEIARKSTNRNMKALATAILDTIEEKDIKSIIVIDNDSDLFIEGSIGNKVIKIQLKSLASYERLERVLLHEAMHLISLDNRELKKQLYEVMNKAIHQVAINTGKTISQVRTDIYGFKNVDEFISEFFTNYAFQESLKALLDERTKLDSIFDTVFAKVKSIIGKNSSSLFNLIDSLMQLVLSTLNTTSEHKSPVKEKPELSNARLRYDSLSEGALAHLLKMGITAKEFEEYMTIEEQNFVKDCCS